MADTKAKETNIKLKHAILFIFHTLQNNTDMSQKNFWLCAAIMLHSAWIFSSCSQNEEQKGKVTTSETPQSEINEPVDTTKNITLAGQVPVSFIDSRFIGREQFKAATSPTGAIISPDTAFVINNIVWANNLDDLIGRVVKVSTNKAGSSKIVEVLSSIRYDSVKVKIREASIKDIEKREVNKESAFSLGFMGVSANIDKRDFYSYVANTVFIGTILDTKIDQSKILASYKCPTGNDCQYYYINSAALKVCETTHLHFTRNNVRADQLPLPIGVPGGAIVRLSAGIYFGNSNSDYVRKNLVFCTLIRVPGS